MKLLFILIKNSLKFKPLELSILAATIEEENDKQKILSKNDIFNQKNCLRCLKPFLMLINPKRKCSICKFYVCKKCIQIKVANNETVYVCLFCFNKK